MEKFVVYFEGEQTVDNHLIDGESVKRKVYESALGFAQHHLLGIGYQPDAGDRRVFQHLVDPLDFPEQILNVLEIRFRRQVHRTQAIRKGPDGFQHPPFQGKHVLHIPVKRGGQADETNTFRSRRTIKHDHIELLRFAVLTDIHQRTQLFHTGEDRHLFGFHRAQTAGPQNCGDVTGNGIPVALDFALDVDFLNPEPWGHFDGFTGCSVKKMATGVTAQVKRISQAVCRVHAHDKGAVTQCRKLDAGCGGDAGLAHASLTAVEKNSHRQCDAAERTCDTKTI